MLKLASRLSFGLMRSMDSPLIGSFWRVSSIITEECLQFVVLSHEVFQTPVALCIETCRTICGLFSKEEVNGDGIGDLV